MKLGSWLAGLLGLGLAAWLVSDCGFDRVAGVLARGGWAIGFVITFHLVQVLASSAAWRAISRRDADRPGVATYALLRWIREGVNNLLPSGQIGGEFVCARLLRRRGMRLVDATAGCVADVTMEMLTQIAFTLCGLALLADAFGTAAHPGGPAPAVVHAIEAGIAGALLLAAGLLGSQLLGGARLVERTVVRLSERFGWQGAAELAGLHDALVGLWRRPAPLAAAAFWHGLSWALGGIEVALALHVLGRPTPIAACLVIEALGQATKAAGFAVPGALGIQEGGYVLVCGFYGIGADTAIALSLVKRLREILLGAPSLLAWQRLEHRAGLRGPAPAAGAVDAVDAADAVGVAR